jgi:hypothetical protein
MTQSNRRTSVSIREDELIVELQDELLRVEWARVVRVHRQVRDRLVGEEIRLILQLEESADAGAPVELLREEQHAGIHWILAFSRIAKEPLVS